MTAPAAAWDLLVRAWLVAVAWYGLRRPARMRWLASIGHPRRLLRAAIVPAGRHFALAIAFLPRPRRAEATVTFLICKALDAFEDLSADRAAARAGLTAAADYLVGRAEHPPHGDALTATRESDRIEALLAARLPLLRLALEALPADAAARGRALIDRIAAGMRRGPGEPRSQIAARGGSDRSAGGDCVPRGIDRRHRAGETHGEAAVHAGAAGGDCVPRGTDRRRYADEVLGAAVGFAAEVAAPGASPPRAACRAAGRALQLANDLRDAETARDRQIALYQALPELPIVPRLLRWLPAGAGAGARAAATLIAVTTCAFYLRHVSRAIPPRLAHPIRAALAGAWSRRAYLATVDAIEAVLRDTLAAAAGVPSELLVRASQPDAMAMSSARAARELAPPRAPAEVAAVTSAGEAPLPPAAGVEAAANRATGRPRREAAAITARADAEDCVESAEILLGLAMQLIHAVPHARLAAAPGGAPGEQGGQGVVPSDPGGAEPGKPIVLADYLLFAAVDRLTELGPGAVARVAALLEQLAAPTDRTELVRSTALAEFAREVA